MDAMIFDFDGVVVDSEPIHFMGFQQVLRTVGIELSRQDYYDKYLGFDDHDCFVAAMRDHGRTPSEPLVLELIANKTQIVQHEIAHSIQPLPGALELIRSAEMAAIPVAICSGALRGEIELALECIGAGGAFMAIVAAEDVTHGKPNPEGYRAALSELSRLSGLLLRADRTIVVEDSPAGIEAGHGAGMKVLAVATSYPPQALKSADRVVPSLERLKIAELDKLLG